MDKKLLFIVNPVSGRKTIGEHMISILNLFSHEKFEVTVLVTQKPRHAVEYVKENGGDYDRIVCAGGDGTLNEVVTGLRDGRHKGVLLGYIPCGSTNDFASNFDMANTDVMDCARRAIGDNIIELDSGVLNDHSFLYTAAFGAFTDITYTTSQNFKNVLGHQAYVISALNHLADIKPIHASIDYGQDTLIEDDFLVGIISNSERVAGFSNLYKGDVDLTDGLFEVLLVKYPKTIAETSDAATSFLQRNWNSRMLYYFKTGNLRLWSDNKISWTLDGEFGGEYSVSTIRNRHNSVRFCV